MPLIYLWYDWLITEYTQKQECFQAFRVRERGDCIREIKFFRKTRSCSKIIYVVTHTARPGIGSYCMGGCGRRLSLVADAAKGEKGILTIRDL